VTTSTANYRRLFFQSTTPSCVVDLSRDKLTTAISRLSGRHKPGEAPSIELDDVAGIDGNSRQHAQFMIKPQNTTF